MDEFIDQFFSPTSWSDEKVSEASSWVDQTGEVYKGNEKSVPATFVPLGHMEESSSMFVSEDSSFELERSLLLGESHSQPRNAHYGSNPSLNGVIDGSSNSCYTDSQLNTTPTICTINYDSPEILPFAIDPSTSPSVQLESGSVGSNDSELSEMQPILKDSHSLNSNPHLWPPSSYGGISSLPTQDELQALGLQGQYLENPSDLLGNNSFKDDHSLQGNLRGLQQKMNNHYLSSFGDQIPIPQGRTGTVHPQMQFPQLNEGHYIDQSPISPPLHPATANNGSLKPRVRARRGQATDPHSIAERLRREKIADRMKNLQELVPSSNKTDKASMLDEIIEYVKFLQLQVKVLSMSRLGAAGAVVPLITDSQAEGSTGFISSQSTNRGLDLFDSSNDVAFEQEVVKLMEANMNKAIQFLQSKGLCLMPIALAAAINGSKPKKPVQTIKEEDDVLITGSNKTR
ncbi:hypothetical protein ACHQM5_029586 [Ranunculus cassubicifolius]